MSRFLFILACGLALAGGAFSQTANDPEDFARLHQDGPGVYTFSWWGRSGRTYFLQFSEDLVSWTYCPCLIETGMGAVGAFGLLETDIPESGRFFLRVKSVPLTASNPFTADFDGDKINNYDETIYGTDPLHSADTDGDGMSDDWERRFGLDRQNPGDAAEDWDFDGVSNLAEYQAGGTDPTDFYNGNLPSISEVSGGIKRH